jgi:hypothetical protein
MYINIYPLSCGTLQRRADLDSALYTAFNDQWTKSDISLAAFRNNRSAVDTAMLIFYFRCKALEIIILIVEGVDDDDDALMKNKERKDDR